MKSLGSVLERVAKPVTPEPSRLYRQIGIRSHGKGIFHKEPVSGESLGDKRVFEVVPDCLVLNIVFAWEQAVARTTQNEIGMIASHRFPMFRPRDGACDIDYLTYFFKSKKGKSLLELASPGGAGRNKTLGQADFLRLSFPMPPAKEQKQIANVLFTWDSAICVVERLISNSKLHRASLTQQLLTQQLRLEGFSGKWKRRKLIELGAIYGGLTGKSKDDFGTGKPFVTYNSVFERSNIDLSKTGKVRIAVGEQQNRVQKGDVIFTQSSETPMEVGMSSVLLEESGELYLNSFCFGLRLNERSQLEPAFSQYLFRCMDFRNQLRELAQGSTRYNISGRSLLRCEVSLPSLEEQRAISLRLRVTDVLVDRYETILRLLKSERKALMRQLLPGERRVHANSWV